MKIIPIETLFDDVAEIMRPRRCGRSARQAAACIFCGRADQAMDGDGCGICDACLDAPLQATGTPDGLDFPSALHCLSTAARR
ncbi:MAG: hypothetical protein BGO05_06975 [Rhizobiales bacterium 63-7]|nr:MAG: hypothetical protein BGO05_06975 [Rhizobiales bacterium 63-7]